MVPGKWSFVTDDAFELPENLAVFCCLGIFSFLFDVFQDFCVTEDFIELFIIRGASELDMDWVSM